MSLMADLKRTPTQPDQMPQDEGLRCLECGCNLTGLSGSICPECGKPIDWMAVRLYRDSLRWGWRPRKFNYWESWPVYLKPLGFLLTVGEVALLPWKFAGRMAPRPRLDWAVAYAAICCLPVVAAWVVPALSLMSGLGLLSYPFIMAVIAPLAAAWGQIFWQGRLLAGCEPENCPPDRPYFSYVVACYCIWPIAVDPACTALASVMPWIKIPVVFGLLYLWWFISVVLIYIRVADPERRTSTAIRVILLLLVAQVCTAVFVLAPVMIVAMVLGWLAFFW